MMQLGSIALLVPDYDEALGYYVGVLGFTLLEDTDLGQGKRWVRIAPPGAETGLLLAQAQGEAQTGAIGNQSGGRVFLFLHTTDFWADYHRLQARGVQFLEEPRPETYGHVVVFRDVYGNKWDLLEVQRGL
ncbi:VOC family protein [Hymenobacter chitinivorans]|uniref:Catechol 2,3-dioxygenase-like lactoylglutathione lyase family enzyme n=2 Tax=Hymenobacter chitinivorans TaxID=89969 RepID=A0A2M9AQ84_9BACT|nr:VOC family protein [Hymenobacter chitinivorans]PJJ47867.1 catechol 2,3-dioxygenase-like lactoylglutathione lyase family enzyme [Hymenobacter chitinivorans DSM 11115]